MSEASILSQTMKQRGDFEMGDMIGEGSYAQVVGAIHKETKREFAIKIVDKKHVIKEKKIESVKREKTILDMINHDNIVKLYSTFQDDNSLYFVLELCPNGELLDAIRKVGAMSNYNAAFYAAEILSGIEYMHQRNIVHRDLKPENILLAKNNHLKITDFGTARVFDAESRDRVNSFCGTADYVSPEVLQSKPSGKGMDLWAFGCIVYQMVAGKPPFKAGNDYMTFQKILKMEYVFPEGFPDDAKDLVQRLLLEEPSKRLGANDLNEIRQHPFFKDIDFARVASMDVPEMKPNDPRLVDAAKQTQSNHFVAFEFIESREKRERQIQEQKKMKESVFLGSDELMLMMGILGKKGTIFTKRRLLILTDKPQLMYIDVDRMVVRGTIEYSPEMKCVAKNKKAFSVLTPKRVYAFEDPDGKAEEWRDKINQTVEDFIKRNKKWCNPISAFVN